MRDRSIWTPASRGGQASLSGDGDLKPEIYMLR